MKLNRLLIWVFIIGLLISACQPATPAPDPLSAGISELSGVVELRNPGNEGYAQASAGMTLQVKGSVRTGADGKAKLDLSNGTIVRVAPSSFFTLESNEQSDDGFITRLRLDAGRLFIFLSDGSLEVDTPSGLASVRGSYLEVWILEDSGDTIAACLEGDCTVTTPDGKTVTFVAGEKVRLFFSNGGPSQDPQRGRMSQEDFDLWLSTAPEAFDILPVATATIAALPSMTPTFTVTPTVTLTTTSTLAATSTNTPTATPTQRIIYIPPPTATETPDPNDELPTAAPTSSAANPTPNTTLTYVPPTDTGPTVFDAESLSITGSGTGFASVIASDPDSVSALYLAVQLNDPYLTSPSYTYLPEVTMNEYSLATVSLPTGFNGDQVFFYMKAYDTLGYMYTTAISSVTYGSECP